MKAPQRRDLPDLYGSIVNGVWARQNEFIISWPVPCMWKGSFRYQGLPVSHIQMNKDMKEPFEAALNDLNTHFYNGLIKSFDGCFEIRKSRTNNKLSVHSYGLAIDLNAATNKLGFKGDMDRNVVDAFCANGFLWGGIFPVTDEMHFQFCWE